MSKISQFTARTAPALADTYTLETGSANYNVEASLIMGLGLFNVSGFRLSSSSTLPVNTGDSFGVTTIYLQPYINNYIIVPDSNGSWKLRTSSAISLSLSGVVANKIYDVFVWDNSGTLTLALGTAWTNTTTRANALTTVNGVYVNGSTEGSMAANKGLHVGMIRSAVTTGQITDAAVEAGITNRYNRIFRKIKGDCGYSNNNASTTNNSSSASYAVFSGNYYVEFFSFAGDTIDICGSSYATNSTTSTQTKLTIGISNSSSALDSPTSAGVQSSAQFQALSGATCFFKTNTLPEGYNCFSLYRIGVTSTTTWSIDLARTGATADPPCTFIEGKILA